MKQNLILKAAVAAAFGVVAFSANAGIANGVPALIATQAAVSNATAFNTGAVTYSTQSPVAMGTVYLYVKLSGGATFTAAPTAGELIAANLGATATVVKGAAVLSTDKTFAYYPLTIGVSSLPVNATFTFTGANANIVNAGFLSTPGFLSATVSVGSTASVTAPVADVDAASSGNAIQTVNGLTFSSDQSGDATLVTGFAAAWGGATETAKINVATGTGVALTAPVNTATTSLINFGGFRFTDVAGVKAADAATAFDTATNFSATGVGGTLTGNFAAAAGTGGKVFLASDVGCTTPLVAGATAALNAGNTVATFSGGTALGSGVATYVCMQVNTPGNAIVIPATTPVLNATLAGASAATATFAAPAASLYALTTNGAAVNVKTYIPAGAAGYTSFVRIVNTGSTTASASAAVIDSTTGVIGTPAVVAANLAPGAAVTLSSTQIEAAVGAIADTSSRPRLQITAPGALAVQSFILTNANGNFSEVSGAE